MSIVVSRKRRRRRSVADRFWEKVKKTRTCWIFPCSPSRDGYGRIRIDYKLRKASRVAWGLQVGPIPTGLDVLHHCDNRLCVRRKHLFLGTHADNNRDCVSKKRHCFGSRNGRAVLDERKIIRIRVLHAQGSTVRELIEKFGSSKSRILAVINKTNWRHV